MLYKEKQTCPKNKMKTEKRFKKISFQMKKKKQNRQRNDFPCSYHYILKRVTQMTERICPNSVEI